MRNKILQREGQGNRGKKRRTEGKRRDEDKKERLEKNRTARWHMNYYKALTMMMVFSTPWVLPPVRPVGGSNCSRRSKASLHAFFLPRACRAVPYE